MAFIAGSLLEVGALVVVVSAAGVSARRGAKRRDTNSLFHSNCICLRMWGAASKYLGEGLGVGLGVCRRVL